MAQRKVQKAWSIRSNIKKLIVAAKADLEKEGYKVIGISTLPSCENVMIIGERPIDV